MKSIDYWKDFIRTGRIDDYLNYIACTREEGIKDFDSEADGQEEGGLDAGINNRDGNGSIGHAGWRL
ncbi:MAG: hypothetical protein GX059_01805 [Clostridiales bacterium]|jgi:hypothetical protein|nr:hypothetical protein [Clostridiales bacterium]